MKIKIGGKKIALKLAISFIYAKKMYRYDE